MSDTNSQGETAPAPDSDRQLTFSQRFSRDALGWLVVGLGAGGVIFLAVVVIANASVAAKDATMDKVFAAVVPLFGTWVGTVLAYYFTRENFQAANATVNKAMDRLTAEQKLAETPVTKSMVPVTALKGIDLSATTTEANLTAKDIVDKISQNRVSRVPIFSPDKSILYIVDDRTAFQVVIELAKAPDQIGLAEFLGHKIQDILVKDLVSSFGVVAESANLAAARDALVAVKGAHEVVVTKTGKRSDPVLGWLTETDIAHSAEIS
jgi:hypothetical protein